MTTVRRSETEIDEAAELAALAQRPAPSETEVEAQALQNGDAWSDEEPEGAEAENLVYEPSGPGKCDKRVQLSATATPASAARRCRSSCAASTATSYSPFNQHRACPRGRRRCA